MSKTTLVIMLLVIIAAAMYVNSTGITNSKPALKMVITSGFDENDTVKVTNMTFEQVSLPFFYASRDTAPKFPEINVFGRIDNLSSGPSSFWASAYRPDDEGVYTLTMVFREGQEPKNGSILILPVKMTDWAGRTIYKTTAFYEWKE